MAMSKPKAGDGYFEQTLYRIDDLEHPEMVKVETKILPIPAHSEPEPEPVPDPEDPNAYLLVPADLNREGRKTLISAEQYLAWYQERLPGQLEKVQDEGDLFDGSAQDSPKFPTDGNGGKVYEMVKMATQKNRDGEATNSTSSAEQ